MSETNQEELVRKVRSLVSRRFGASYERAFQYYATKRSVTASVDSDELSDLLKDADIGNRITRGRWVTGIMQGVDRNRDGKISWREFETGVMAK